ncbi:MAG: OB-fold nucleic acid binding domain-containing protein [Thermoproteota archaeon]|nr:hypothetical protein [Candidatus Brockarchaeota archaeon]
MEQSLVDKYISVIISSRPDISRDQLVEMIEERSKKVKIGNNYKKLYTLFLIAQELGIKLEQASLSEQAIKISNVLPNLRNITLIGRVIGISSKNIAKQDEEEVRVSKIYLGDETGQCVVVLWREKAELPELLSIKENDVIQVQGGYSKEGRFGIVEVHIGSFGTITKVQESFNLPSGNTFFIPISEIPEKQTIINTKGIIRQVSPQKGKLRRIIVADGKTEIAVSLWQSMSKLISEEDVGKWVYLVGAKTRLGINGKLELSLDENGCLKLGALEEGYSIEQKIKDAKEGITINLKCKILKVFEESKRNIPGFGIRKVKELIVYDDSGIATVTIWANENETMPELKEGEIIKLSGAKVRKGPPEVILYTNLGGISKIEDKNLALLPLMQLKPVKIKDIKENQRNIIIEGLVISTVKRQEFTDEEGNPIEKAEVNVADDTGLIRVVSWREDCEKIKGLKINIPVRVLWADTKRDQFTGETYVLVTKKTMVESIEMNKA